MTYEILGVFGIFTVVSLLLYSLSPQKYRHIVLLCTSMTALLYLVKGRIIYIIITVISTYAAAIIMEEISNRNNTSGLEKSVRKQIKAKVRRKKKIVVSIYILINLGILFTLKYLRLFAPDALPSLLKLALPLGISYYTLQSLSYVIDVFRGKYMAERSPVKLALFITFLPQLHEGPFGRYDQLSPLMFSNKRIESENLFAGAESILKGLFKIFMIANRASIIADAIFKDYSAYNGIYVLVGGISFLIQLYAEFSGYIDIASGISEMFGIKLAENFNMPFISHNVAEFWRRWHISLGSWFRDYVFYPVSTSKWMNKITSKMNDKAGDFVNITISLFIVWFLTGLWHGASVKYIVYGLYYFVLMIMINLLGPVCSRILSKYNLDCHSKVITVLSVIKTQFFVIIGMIMFRAENLSVFFNMMCHMVAKGPALPLYALIEPADFAVLIISLVIMVLSAVLKLKNIDLSAKLTAMPLYARYFTAFVFALVIIVFGAYGPDYIPPDPIYGGF